VRDTLRAGAHGGDVIALQQLLLEAGLMPPFGAEEWRASHFGSVTEGAVKTFQIKRSLVADGIVGKRTWAALEGVQDDGDTVPAPDYENTSNLMSAALRIAHGELIKGVHEHSVNRGPEIDEYLLGRYRNGRYLLNLNGAGKGAPWCARFVVWCIEGAAMAFGSLAPTAGGGDLASATKFLSWAKKTKRLVEHPHPGCVALVKVEGHGHVWLVARVDGERHVSVEGNASNRVLSRWRPNSGEGLHFISLD
jgi:hypothetical protein